MKPINTAGKRKSAIARAVLKEGTGKVRINRAALDVYEPRLARLKLREPLVLAGDYANKVDIKVNVFGGGVMSQAEAARLAIAKALVAFAKDKKLEKTFLDYDRHLLVADVRQRETRKPNKAGKARAAIQKSYR
jgi:small subunit ribosomal protein S9